VPYPASDAYPHATTYPGLNPPTVTVVSGPTAVKISRVAGKDETQITWESNYDFQDYQIRIVPSAISAVTSGTQLETNQTPPSGGTALTDYTATVSDDEMVAAMAAEGSNILKVFVQKPSGEWSE
jgi:hypothetical protein